MLVMLEAIQINYYHEINNRIRNWGHFVGSCSGNKQKTEEKVTQQQKPNVIFLIADDIGYGDLSCYGEKTIHTPNVEKLASRGIRFTDAHSVAATSTPSRYSLFTGIMLGDATTRGSLPVMPG